MHHHYAHPGMAYLGVNAEEFVAVLLRQVYRIADDDGRRDFIGPTLLARIVRRREG